MTEVVVTSGAAEPPARGASGSRLPSGGAGEDRVVDPGPGLDEDARRLLLLAPLLLFTAGCGVVQSSEDEETDAVREVARKAGERLYGRRPRTAEEVGRSASGIDVVVRASGSAYNGWLDPEQVAVRRCFAVRVYVRVGVG